MYLFFNASGREYSRWASHFDPTSPIFSKRERAEVGAPGRLAGCGAVRELPEQHKRVPHASYTAGFVLDDPALYWTPKVGGCHGPPPPPKNTGFVHVRPDTTL
jgi:hypothetical protein